MDDQNFFLEIFFDLKRVCRHPLPVYISNYDDFFIQYSGGFDMNTGQPKNFNQNQPTVIKLCIEVDNEFDSRNMQYDVH